MQEHRPRIVLNNTNKFSIKNRLKPSRPSLSIPILDHNSELSEPKSPNFVLQPMANKDDNEF